MSLPLKDFRLGITPEIDRALTAVATAFGRDKQDVAREVLGEWAARKHHEYSVAAKLEYVQRSELEHHGTSRHGGHR